MIVKFFSEKKKAKKISFEIQKKVKDMLNSGQYTNGKYVKKFEEHFKKHFNAKYCVAVNNGTSALHLSLLALKIKKDDEIIVPSMTFIASAAAINYVGAKPIFVDVNESDWLINPNLIEKYITKKTKAIMVVHLHGLMCDMDKIRKVAMKYKIKLIEDAAQTHGSLYKDQSPGYFSDVATFSFYPTKNLGAVGEGGAILTNNKDIFEKTKRMRTWSHKKHDFFEIGFNYRMTEFSAISLLAKLKFLNSDIKRRIIIAKKYKDNLKTQNFSIFNEKIKKHSYHIFAITVDAKKRKKIMTKLKLKGIDTNIHYPYNLSELEVFNKKKNKSKSPVSQRISKEFISLPIYPELDDKKILYTCKILNQVLDF
jgi:dTDP-4-amino-4,6-dideoxygalactose transaminase